MVCRCRSSREEGREEGLFLTGDDSRLSRPLPLPLPAAVAGGDLSRLAPRSVLLKGLFSKWNTSISGNSAAAASIVAEDVGEGDRGRGPMAEADTPLRIPAHIFCLLQSTVTDTPEVP